MAQHRKTSHNSPASWQVGLLTAVCIVLALILIAMIFVTAFAHHMLNQLNREDPGNLVTISPSQAGNMTDPDVETIDPSSTETLPNITDVTVPTEPEYKPVRHGDHVVNIMLVGSDARPGESRQRSDSMILVTVNKSNNTITLTSFMRDQYVQIPGYKNNKLNAAYAWGGFPLMNETLKVNFGVFVDGNVEVNFESFMKVIDLLGGVDVTLTEIEANYLNEHFGWNLVKGNNLLTGEQALNYSRIRVLDSDYRRAERQRTVLISLINRYKSRPLDEMISIMYTILPTITTNMSNDQILDLAGDLLPLLGGAQINTLRIPVDGTFSQGDVQIREGLKNWFQYNIDFPTNRQILQHIFEK